MSQLFVQGMSLARSCMTTVSDPDLASNPPAQWHTLNWKNSYWSSLEMTTQLFKDAMAAGMRINACFYLSDGPAHASLQNAPTSWRNLSVTDTAALVEQYAYDTTTHLINQGIQVDLYDIGNEILFGILNFRPGDRLPPATGIDTTRSVSYLRTSVWPTEATLLTAAIRGVRRADPNARIVLHIESLLSPGMDTAFAFFQTMQSLGVPYDVAGISLPYMDGMNLSDMTAQEYYHRLNYLVNRIASLGKPVYIAENSYPADTDPAFNPPMPDFLYTETGQTAYANSQLRWASNNSNIIGWTWFYPEWFPGINPSAPHVLEVQGLYRDRQTFRPAAGELNVALPHCPVLTYPYSQAFVAAGGDGTVAVTSGTGCSWTAASTVPWISITSGSSGSGDGTVSYSVSSNSGTTSRTGTMTLAGLTFTVTQDGIQAASITLTSPPDQTSFSACSVYSRPSFSWDSAESFKNYEIQFSSSDTFSSITAKVKTSANEVQPSSSAWKKILLAPGATGGTVYWKAVGTRQDKTKAESDTFSILIEGAHTVEDPQISSTGVNSLPSLSWTTRCNMKFKVTFGDSDQFSSRKTLSFKLKDVSETFTKELTSGQWSSIKKIVRDVPGATLYWYVESWDGLRRYTKTDVMSFVLTD
jgi:hypothetical protein